MIINTLTLIRHGPNEQGAHLIDPPLNEDGILHMVGIANLLNYLIPSTCGKSVILCSPALRAQQSAALAKQVSDRVFLTYDALLVSQHRGQEPDWQAIEKLVRTYAQDYEHVVLLSHHQLVNRTAMDTLVKALDKTVDTSVIELGRWVAGSLQHANFATSEIVTFGYVDPTKPMI